MKKRYLSILPMLGLAVSGCIEEQGSVFIEGFQSFEYGQCSISPAGTARAQGVLDIGALPEEANGYDGVAVVVTNLPATVNNQIIQQTRQQQPNYPNYGTADTNVVVFNRARVYFTDDRGEPLNIANITPENPRETPLGSAVYNVQTNLGAKSAVLAPLITQTEALSLQRLDNADLAQIAELAALANDSTNRFRIIAQVQVIGRTTGGATVVSPEFGYPIELCQRCLARVGMEAGQSECPPGENLTIVQDCTPGQDTLSSVCQ